jgi:Family of unknown function (DUF6298)
MRLILSVFLIFGITGNFSPAKARLVVKNRYWLENLTNSETLWLFGHGITNLISQVQVDVTDHNRHYAEYGANCFRLHLTQGALGPGSPWKQLPDGRYDLKAWNDLYWERLRTFMEDCLRRGIYPFIQIWDEPVIERGATRWRVHPFRPSNNINDLAGLSDDPESHGMKGFYNIRNRRLMEIQRLFVQRVLDVTAHYGICIFSICNEYDYGNRAPLDWQKYWIDFFRDYEREHPRLSAPLLYTNTAVKKYMDAGCEYFPVVDWYYLEGFRLKSFGRHGVDLKGTSADTLAALVSRSRKLYPGKILINSRATSSPDRGRKDFSNEEESRRLAWCSLMSAVHLAGFRHLNPRDQNDTEPWNHADPDCVTCTDGLAAERVIRSVRTFLRLAKPELGRMVPETSLEGESPVFKLVGADEIIIYLPEGGLAEIHDLDRYRVVRRYDPVHPERGLIPPERETLKDSALRAPAPETVFFLQVE